MRKRNKLHKIAVMALCIAALSPELIYIYILGYKGKKAEWEQRLYNLKFDKIVSDNQLEL